MWSSDAPIELLEEVVVAGSEDHASHKAWAAAEVAANGDLLVAHKDASDHGRTADSFVMLARSRDNGKTWTTRMILPAAPDGSYGWITNHGMTRLHDGTIVMNVIRHWNIQKNGERKYSSHGSFMRSRDNGETWEGPFPEFVPSFLNDLGETYSYGRIMELSDGRLMAPFAGVPRGMDDYSLRSVGVGFSSDGGETWGDYSIIHDDRVGDLKTNETDLLKLKDGRYLAMVRSNPTKWLYKSFSSDEGKTWTPIEKTEIPGNCPSLLRLNSGAILCGFRDRRAESPGMGFGVSYDEGASWQSYGNLYEAPNWDCAYPSLVRLPNGNIFCSFYTSAVPDIYGPCEIHGYILRDKTM